MSTVPRARPDFSARQTLRNGEPRPLPPPPASRGGTLRLPARQGGPGSVEISASGVITLEGRAGAAARIELARQIEAGAKPFQNAVPAQQQAIAAALVPELAPGAQARKPSAQRVLARSAAAT